MIMDYEKILKKIRPTAGEKALNKKISQRLIAEIAKEGHEAVLVGSRARDTFISGDRDLDIFFFFPEATKREEFEKKGVALGKKILAKNKPTVHYAEHPYVKGIVDGIVVEIVPCYKMKDRIISAVDRSPLHNEYVKKNLKPAQRDDVLLLKQFLKAARIYGASQKVKAFSGVLCETLIIQFGSFERLLKESVSWKPQVIIDPLQQRREYKKFSEPLVVIDPTDKERNMAAAVSAESFVKFVETAAEFLEHGSEEFFFPKKEEKDFSALVSKNALALAFAYPKEIVEEIVWSQLERIKTTLANKLREADFRVVASRHWTDEKKKCMLFFEIENLTLSEKKKHEGPFVADEKNVANFKKVNKETWVEGDRIFAWKKRKFTDAEKLLKSLLIDKKIIPSHLAKVFADTKILGKAEILKEKAFLEETIE